MDRAETDIPRDGGGRPLVIRRPRATLLAALAVAALATLAGIGEPLWGSEGRFADVAREMISSGDYLRMTIAGRPYVDKPWGSYWLIAAGSRLTGGVTEGDARLPGVIAFLLTVLVTFRFGVRTLGREVGALAALLLATSLRVVFWSRTASADPQTMLGTTLALLLILELSEAPGFARFVALGLLTGACSLLKGLSGIAVPAFVALTWSIFVRGFRWLRPLPLLAGAFAFLLALGAPFLVVAVRGDWGPLELLWRESVVRAFEPFDHVQPVYYYVWNQFDLFAPWALFLPAALLAAWRGRPRAGGRRRLGLPVLDTAESRRRAFPLFCYLAIFALFTLSRSRRTYYLMPAAPFLSLWIANFLLGAPVGAVRLLRNAAFALLGALGVVAGVLLGGVGAVRLATDSVPAFLPAADRIPGGAWAALPPWLVGLVVAAPLGIVLLARLRTPGRDLVSPAVLLAAIAAFAMTALRADLREATETLPPFCAKVNALLPEGAPVAGDFGGDARLVYYLDRSTWPETAKGARYRIASGREAPRILAEEPGAWTIALRERPDAPEGSREARKGYVLLERTGGSR